MSTYYLSWLVILSTVAIFAERAFERAKRANSEWSILRQDPHMRDVKSVYVRFEIESVHSHIAFALTRQKYCPDLGS